LPATGRDEQTAAPGADAGLYHLAMAQLACTLGALVAGPLLAVLAFWVLLRRHGRRHGPLFRFEVANPPLHGLTPPSASPPAPMHVSAAPSAPPRDPEPENRAEAFDLGPNVGDVSQQKHDAARRQEDGILRHLVDQNLKLMEQIGQLETATHR